MIGTNDLAALLQARLHFLVGARIRIEIIGQLYGCVLSLLAADGDIKMRFFLGVEADVEIGAFGGQVLRHRIETESRATHGIVQSAIAEHYFVFFYLRLLVVPAL